MSDQENGFKEGAEASAKLADKLRKPYLSIQSVCDLGALAIRKLQPKA